MIVTRLRQRRVPPEALLPPPRLPPVPEGQSMLQAAQDWDEVLGRSDSLAEGVKAANKIKLRPAVQR